MKELTIEEKAKAYDDALERARELSKSIYGAQYEYIFPELKESEDERIRKSILNYLTKMWGNCQDDICGVNVEDAIAWLEKQGEQKSADKVEPKFKVGDWIISNDKKSTYQVIEVKRGIYVIRDNADSHDYYIGIEECEKSGRLWTISDAKDGDVLAFDDEIIVIFKNLYNTTTFHSYCYVEEGAFNVSQDDIPDWWNGNGFHPATKEQRELLFKKIKEAGYMWDAEKKELKKIKKTDYEPDALIEESYQQQADDLIDMVTEKPAWSEEDDYLLNETIQHLEELIRIDKTKHCSVDVQYYQRDIDWLKSLKERLHTQNTWKPSEEQIEVLQKSIKAYNEVSFPTEVRILSSLCNELKKL